MLKATLKTVLTAMALLAVFAVALRLADYRLTIEPMYGRPTKTVVSYDPGAAVPPPITENAASDPDEDPHEVIGNPGASVRLHVEVFDGLQRKVAVVESIWPNHAFLDGVGINALISATAGAPLGGAVFHDTAVWIEAAQDEDSPSPQ